MPTLHTLLTFALVSVGLAVLPGTSTFFLLAHGIGHGRRSALAAMVGIETAAAIRIGVVAAGLAAVLASSAVVFSAVRWAGIGYLCLLGLRALRAERAGDERPGRIGRPMPWFRSTGKGVLVGLGNPKMLIFFVAFFPQFVEPGRGSAVAQMLILGAIFWIIGTAWDVGLAMASGTIGAWLIARPRWRSAQPRAEGAAYLSLAAWSAIGGSGR